MKMRQFLDVTTATRRHVVCALTLMLCVDATARAQVTAPRTLNAAEAQRVDVQRGLAARQDVKISVRHSGSYRVGQPDLVGHGLPANTNPHNLRLFADGIEVPLRVMSNGSKAEGRFDSSDAIEFYGTALD